MEKYRLFDHTADVGCEISGKTRKELFANGIAALFDLMLEPGGDWGKSPDQTMPESLGDTFTKRYKLKSLEEKRMAIEGSDLEDLLVNFLREALYLFNGEKWVVAGCEIVELTTKHIIAQLSGEPYNSQKHHVKMEVKAVTYHGLSVERIKNSWVARVIFDV